MEVYGKSTLVLVSAVVHNPLSMNTRCKHHNYIFIHDSMTSLKHPELVMNAGFCMILKLPSIFLGIVGSHGSHRGTL